MGVDVPQASRLLCLPVQTAWGWLAAASRGAGIARCCLPTESAEAAVEAARRGADAVVVGPGECEELDRAAEVLLRYFGGEPVGFEVALDLAGLGSFSSLVLAACNRIPYGGTCCYGELAARVGRPRAARAVGQVMRRNPLAPLVPCHRVVGSGGALTGFGGGLELKRRMLELETVAKLQHCG